LSTHLDFGTNAFTGMSLWLDIAVRPGASTNDFVALTPRQPVTPTPYALFAPNAGTAATASAVAVGAVSSAQLKTLAAPTNGQVLSFSGKNLVWTNGSSSAGSWSLNGNAGTSTGVNFLGTTDNQPLELWVNGARTLRLEPNVAGARNVIGGSPVNAVDAGVVGAFIGGGGATNYFTSFPTPNRVSANFGAIGGGILNTINTNANLSSIGGGFGNTANGTYATVGGGYNNTALLGDAGTVGGGSENTAGGYATVAGGYHNTASGQATVGGGQDNSATASLATVAGGGANSASGYGDTVGGGSRNTASESGTTVGGGSFNTASGNHAAVAGGALNTASGSEATLAGGGNNTASGRWATVAGGLENVAAGINSFAAGYRAMAIHDGAFVWADLPGFSGIPSFSSTATNEFSVRAKGGARFVTAIDSSGSATAGVQLAAGGGSCLLLAIATPKKTSWPSIPRFCLRNFPLFRSLFGTTKPRKNRCVISDRWRRTFTLRSASEKTTNTSLQSMPTAWLWRRFRD
jgi:hypothetical protein